MYTQKLFIRPVEANDDFIRWLNVEIRFRSLFPSVSSFSLISFIKYRGIITSKILSKTMSKQLRDHVLKEIEIDGIYNIYNEGYKEMSVKEKIRKSTNLIRVFVFPEEKGYTMNYPVDESSSRIYQNNKRIETPVALDVITSTPSNDEGDYNYFPSRRAGNRERTITLTTASFSKLRSTMHVAF